MKISRLLLILAVTLGLAFLVHLWIYSTYFSYETISNSMFVVGMILFLPSLVVLTKAYEVFQGIHYAFRVLVNPSYRKTYPRFSDFKEDHSKQIKTTVFYEILLASFLVVIVAVILAGVAMR